MEKHYNTNSNLEFKKTKDGSFTLYDNNLDETYHTLNGAIEEAKYVYIEQGLKYINKENGINIFELGFGAGLNTILTIIDCIENGRKINYHTVELKALGNSIITKLNYFEYLDPKYQSIFNTIHDCNWNEESFISDNIKFTKYKTNFKDYLLNNISSNNSQTYDLIYYDAFAPSRQPALWEDEIVYNCLEMLNYNGVIVTYSATSKFTKQLKNYGLKVEKLKGFGKREMTRAINLNYSV